MRKMLSEIKNLKDQVEHILEHYPESRNYDRRLTIELWKMFYPEMTPNGCIDLEDIMELPSQDGIKRLRATIQNDERRYPPTDQKIAEERGWLEDEWKKALGYAVKEKEPCFL